jgi:uncharacterized membrane protein YdjX (TVP38/TMEM64 family)
MANSETMSQPKSISTSGGSSVGSKLAKGAVVLLILALLIAAGRALGGYIPQFAEWVETLGLWGPLVFVAGYAGATVAFIPGSLLTLAAGAIFGLAKGTAYVFIGATLGSALAFLVARYVARQAVERRLEGHPTFDVVDKACGREGLKIVFLLRLSPAFPYNLLNYALGLTSVRFRDYFIASLGMIPATFLFVYYGKALGSLAAVAGGAPIERGTEYWVVLGLGLVATLVVTTLVTRLARKALKQEVEDG